MGINRLAEIEKRLAAAMQNTLDAAEEAARLGEFEVDAYALAIYEQLYTLWTAVLEAHGRFVKLPR